MVKKIFTKKEEIVMLEEGNNYFNEGKDNFKELLKVKIQNIAKTKNKVESHICYGKQDMVLQLRLYWIQMGNQ